MKKMNKKGFTLIELLAVIVVLAIVMVIATQKITDVINSSRSNAFISSYKMIVKQINTNMVTNTDDIQCGGSGTDSRDCKEVYDISDDYKLTVASDDTKYIITLEVAEENNKKVGKFKNLNLTKYGDASSATKNGNTTEYKCDKTKISSTVSSCTANTISGSVAK